VDGAGDVWTWTALDADSKMILSWSVGGREADSAKVLMDDLAARLAHKVQLTTDGHHAYLQAVDEAFGEGIDYAMLVKLYGEARPVDRSGNTALASASERGNGSSPERPI
jgi:transposase-like protein